MEQEQEMAPGQGGAPQEQAKGVQLPPKVKEVFQRLLMAAMKYIYSENVTPGIVQAVQSAQDPVQGIVQATKAVVGQVASKAKGINPDVVQRIAVPVAALITELVVKAGVQDDGSLLQRVTAALKGGGAPQEQQAPEQAPQEPQGLVAAEMGA